MLILAVGDGSGGGAVLGIILILVLIAVYFLPSIVAARNNHHNTGAIAALNFFLGWSLIGWVAALVWALSKPAPTPAAERVDSTQWQ